MPSRSRSRFVVASAALIGASMLAACGSSTSNGDRSPASTTNGAAATSARTGSGPVKLTQCGNTVNLRAPARRAVTLNQNATEMVLAMGLSKDLIGSSLLDSSVLPSLKPAYDKVKVLSSSAYPSKEALLGINPDLLIGGFGPTFSDSNNLPADQFAAAGVGTFTMQCKSTAINTDTTLDTVTKLGEMFGDAAAATNENASLTKQFAAVRAQVTGKAPVSVMIFDSGDTAPTVVGKLGMANAITTLAGGRNVFGDVNKEYLESSFEEVVARNPSVIVVLDYSPDQKDSATPKIKALKANPALANVAAVRNNRFVVLPLTGMGAVSPRNGTVAQTLADALHPRS